ncbi:MAG: carbamoyl-phosphate synthase large subunit, partial [Mariprofundales bacterium]|nr:carbamoyl-phosphate synthase large subunit [Mariprofundales bacterium]
VCSSDLVTKIPRFAFEKFDGADNKLTTQMKSVGEVMAIGRTFTESLGKAMRGLERGSCGFDFQLPAGVDSEQFLQEQLASAGADRLWWLGEALRRGWSRERVCEVTNIDPWFIHEIGCVVELEQQLCGRDITSISHDEWWRAKREGLSDARLATLLNTDEQRVFQTRTSLGVKPVFKRVDTCAAEFEAATPYLYSTYEEECEAAPTQRKKVMILGGGPNRIGQGIEFDYCCVHAAFALSADGFETIMVNCNPETVSTDYDTSDRLYFESLTFEDVMAIVAVEQPEGVIVQFGGQTPLKLADALQEAGVPIIGTSPDMIDLAEDRERFQQLLNRLNLLQPDNGTARSVDEALAVATDIGYPVVVRPSYVLGGRAMRIVHDESALLHYMREAVSVSSDHPVLLDRFLNSAIELDVDALADGQRVVVGGIMEHIEEAGVHSGDSACCLPPHSIAPHTLTEVRRQTEELGLALQVKGLLNIQFALQGESLFVLEVNPRASRTVPFVSKATGVPLAKMAARIMSGQSLDDLGLDIVPQPEGFRAVKEAVFPFVKFRGVDPLLSPEMKSTGEVMALADDFATAFGKAQWAAGLRLPQSGSAFISVRNSDKASVVEAARLLVRRGFKLLTTIGTYRVLQQANIDAEVVAKVIDGRRPHIVDRLLAGDVDLVINTTEGEVAIRDSKSIRQATLDHGIAYFTTLAGGVAAAQAVTHGGESPLRSLQEYHQIERGE